MKNDCLYKPGAWKCPLVIDYELLQAEIREAEETYHSLLSKYRYTRNELNRVRNILSKYGIPTDVLHCYETSEYDNTLFESGIATE